MDSLSSSDGWNTRLLSRQDDNPDDGIESTDQSVICSIKNSLNESSFLAACREGNEKAVKHMLRKAPSLANLEFLSNASGKMVLPLNLSSWEGHDSVVKVLLRSGADVNVFTDGMSALSNAVYKGHYSVLETIINYPDIEIEQRTINDAFFWAAQKGCENSVKLLLLHGADINSVIHNGGTALAVAAQNNHDGVVELILQHSIKIDWKQNRGALCVAAQNNHVQVVKLLLQYGAKVNDTFGVDGATPLNFASEKGHALVVQVLLSGEPNLHTTCKAGATALLVAAQNGHADVVDLLLTHSLGTDLLHVQFVNKPRNSDAATALLMAVSAGHFDVVDLLLQKNADADQKASDGKTPLFVAAREGYSDIGKKLLSNGAKPDSAYCGMTPLGIAAGEVHPEMVNVLLEGGADSTLKSQVITDGEASQSLTPLGIAKMNRPRVYLPEAITRRIDRVLPDSFSKALIKRSISRTNYDQIIGALAACVSKPAQENKAGVRSPSSSTTLDFNNPVYVSEC